MIGCFCLKDCWSFPLSWCACRFLNAFVFCLTSGFVVVFIHEENLFVTLNIFLGPFSNFGMTSYNVRTCLSLCYGLTLTTAVAGSYLLMYSLLWPCPPLPLMTFQTETVILLTCLSGDSGLCFVSLSFALISQMFPLGGSCLSSLETVKGTSDVSAMSSAQETLCGGKANSMLTSEWSLVVDETLLSLDVYGGFDFWSFNLFLGWNICWLFLLTSQQFTLGAGAGVTLTAICVWGGAEDCWGSSDPSLSLFSLWFSRSFPNCNWL